MLEQRLAMATCFLGNQFCPVPPPDIRQGLALLTPPCVPTHRERPNILCSDGDLPICGLVHGLLSLCDAALRFGLPLPLFSLARRFLRSVHISRKKLAESLSPCNFSR